VVAGTLDTHLLNPPAVANSRAPLKPIQFWPGFLPYAAGGNLGVKKDLYERIGGFSEEPPALEDTDFSFRVQLDGMKTLAAVEEAVVAYRYRSSFSEIAQQARSYARAELWLRRRYEPRGMPRLGVSQIARALIGMLIHSPMLLTERGRPAYAWRFGHGTGRLRAIVQQRYRPSLR
jgi:GT2 family glycosyltransferase